MPEAENQRSTKFLEIARDITSDIASTDGWNLADVERLVAEHLYDFALHLLWHTIPASGSTIKKYQGMSIEEIANILPEQIKPLDASLLPPRVSASGSVTIVKPL